MRLGISISGVSLSGVVDVDIDNSSVMQEKVVGRLLLV